MLTPANVSGSTVPCVAALRPDSLTVPLQLKSEDLLTVSLTPRMPESDVRRLSAFKEMSGFKGAVILMDVLRSAITMPGGQCVIISGMILMLKSSADSWNFPPVVRG